MGNYKIRIKKSAIKELRKLPKKNASYIIEIIQSLGTQPRPRGCKKLKGYDELWRVRSGNYRDIYTIEDQILIVEILEIVHRKDAY